MNLPEIYLGWAVGICLSRGHHSHGESNPAHFFVNPAAPKAGFRVRAAQPMAHELPPEAASCPFSVQGARKLMQKIHRLTDN
jgi:hypothetical protein